MSRTQSAKRQSYRPERLIFEVAAQRLVDWQAGNRDASNEPIFY